MKDSVVIALALLCLLEGFGPLLFPKRWKNMILALTKVPAQQIRQVGMALVGLAFLLLMSIKF
ncbi:DUF2065 family protein [Alginatibacterium sediminis]|uniref:DUF2065 family protein n=1 Tax=Alginatibacterium sediminis TaxID=2164068 RepID=A0A420E7Y1_9ALTE|nr:DUF2065 family protein [Alginatibacterium sediminis]RKF14529.1 DUF2065 family protein [Alginatibacterium sediminis]